ncbi:MAG: sensor histidine kinase [Chloroflexi bacterium]|nr:sensor histidine kinase [Chloroflexota bacterium]
MISLFRLICPFPTIGKESDLMDGLSIAQPSICARCKTRDCWTHLKKRVTGVPSHFACPSGMSLVLLEWPQGEMLCNGIIVKLLNDSCPKATRDRNQSQKVSWDEVCKWHENMAKAAKALDAEADRKAQEAIDGLHDVKTAVSLVTRNAEAIIAEQQGDTDDEKIENAPNALKSLLKSVQLLHTRLSMSSILSNRESASYGRKHPTPVYKVFHRMAMLFEQLAAKRQVTIRMQGASYLKPPCFDSFETIAMILIDNAVKYSSFGKEVHVAVRDSGQKEVQVAVQSYGPVVPTDMREAIFRRGVRTPGASKLVSSGSGLGLYIADIVAKAHGFLIQYQCHEVNQDGTQGFNVFSFSVPTQ